MFKIASLFLKPGPGEPMQQVRTVEAQAGFGLLGDCNANAASPRQVLVVSRRSIADLALSGGDLRANLVIDGDLESVVSGTILAFGSLKLRMTIPCEPCGKLNAMRPRLSRDIGARRGLLARVVSSGTLKIGDRGVADARSAQPLAPDWKDRVRHIVAQIPAGKVITYGVLVTVAGVQSAYCRALPAVLRSMREDVPVHRVAPFDPRKIAGGQLQKLRGEGVDVGVGTIPYWNSVQYFAAQEAIWST